MEEQKNLTPDAPVEVVDIQFRPGQKVYFFDPAGITCRQGDHVIIDTARGPEFGIVTAGNHTVAVKEIVAPLRCVLRLANEQDERTARENQAKEKRAFEVCSQKIVEHGLDMQLVSAEYAFDGSKILFFFTADERVDFRELVKNLAGVFHTRIELRQIGVRDKAKMVGGLGICGRPFCCASFLEDFQPVSIKMAKTQNLSLNPTKISGTCGRLMCCLKYEQDAYEDLLRTSPKAESFVDTPEGRGTVVEVDLLRQRVKVKMEDQPEVISTFPNTEIAVLRNGKPKKNDPPIPADLAPVSGNGKRERKSTLESSPVFLDSIRFRYSTETIADETAHNTREETEQLQDEPAKRSRRRRSRGKAKAEHMEEAAVKQKKTPKAEEAAKKAPEEKPKAEKVKQDNKPKTEKPKAEGTVGEAKKPHHRPHRRRRPKAPGSGSSAE